MTTNRMTSSLLTLSTLLLCTYGFSPEAEEVPSPAIIPWSKYQERVRARAPPIPPRSPPILDFSPRRTLQQSAMSNLIPAMEQDMSNPAIPIATYSTSADNRRIEPNQLLKSLRPPGSQSVIRPQLRNRNKGDEQRLAHRKIPKEVDPPHDNPPQSKSPFAAAVEEARRQQRPPVALPSSAGAIVPRVIIPSEAESARRLSQFGSRLVEGAPPRHMLTSPQYTRLAPAAHLALGEPTSGGANIVHSIFAQSQKALAPSGFSGIPHGVASGFPTVPSSVGAIPNGLPSMHAISVPHFQEAIPAAGAISEGSFPLGGGDVLLNNGAPAMAAPGASPLDGLLAQGSAFDQFSKLAKNLLGGSGQSNLLETMTSALSNVGRPGIGTASAVDAAPSVEVQRMAEPSIMQKLLNMGASALNDSLRQKERQDRVEQIKKEDKDKDQEKSKPNVEYKQARTSKDVANSLKLLEVLPQEQRALLEEALKSGEIDAAALAPAIKSLVKDDTMEDSKKEKENRLLDWIKANRPAKPTPVASSTAPDKLPYYGKYCGSFAVPDSLKRQVKPSGAVWAVDNQRFIITKFIFQPASLTENVTFWLGPNETTNDPVADSFPSQNGFYVRPEPMMIGVYIQDDVKKITARVRKTSPPGSADQGSSPGNELLSNSLRVRRDAVVHVERDELPPIGIPVSDDDDVHMIVKGRPLKVHEDVHPVTVYNKSSSQNDELTRAIHVLSPTKADIFNKVVPRGFDIRPPVYIDAQEIMSPLDWHAGFQPLLISLPPTKHVKNINWLSLRDNKKQETIASVIMPNGPAFTIPSMTQLRPLTPNGFFNISSGPIKVIDHKTIEITEFKLDTNGVALWFMIGTDILPNASGSIVPLFNRTTVSFDCDSLRDYAHETVTLRLPGKKDINDVFWLSVFSIPSVLSYSHIYLPYNEMAIPPDLSALSTPECIFSSAA